LPTLLAVDLGIKTGLALYDETGRLCWYRSKNFGNRGSLRRGIPNLLAEIPDLTWLIIEGGGPLADIWQKAADRRNILVRLVSAETWRHQLLLPRHQRRGSEAKYHADQMARQVIAWSNAPRPTTLRHDTAEAILIGLWGVLKIGWLDQLPAEIQRRQ